MFNKINNYKVLFISKLLKNILDDFLNIFLVLYFLEVSDNNILPIGIYNLISMVTVWIVIFLTRNFCKSEKRIIFMRIGIILYFFYFLSIIILKEKVVDYAYFIGFLYGLEEGFYYSVYNMIESDGITNKERTKFIGFYSASKNFISIIFPLIFGGLIQKLGFLAAAFFALIIVTFKIILSYIFKDTNIPKRKHTNFKEFKNIIKKHPTLKRVYENKICSGLTYSSGALSLVITIYIIKVFKESISLGIFTSIFSILAIIIGILFVKVIKPKYYNKLMIITSFISILLLCLMLVKCNFITIVLYNLSKTISKGLSDLVNDKNIFNLANLDEIKKEFKVEYFVKLETSLFIGRTISNTLFILMAFTTSNLIMIIFVIFAIMYDLSSIRLEYFVKNKEKFNE